MQHLSMCIHPRPAELADASVLCRRRFQVQKHSGYADDELHIDHTELADRCQAIPHAGVLLVEDAQKQSSLASLSCWLWCVKIAGSVNPLDLLLKIIS